MKGAIENKKSVIVIIGLILSMFMISVVSAQYRGGSFGTNIDLQRGSENIINGVVDIIGPFLQVILGGEDYTGLLLFERFLLFMIILSIVYFAISRVSAFEDNKGVIWVITLIVPILSIRYMNFMWINSILIQYQVLGIALTSLLPFIIYLFFLHNVSEDSTIRKFGWILFIVVYFGLWATNPEQNYGIIYFWTMAIALLMLLADGSLHRLYLNQILRENNTLDKFKYIINVEKEINDINSSSLNPRIKTKLIKKKTKELVRLRKMKSY